MHIGLFFISNVCLNIKLKSFNIGDGVIVPPFVASYSRCATRVIFFSGTTLFCMDTRTTGMLDLKPNQDKELTF